MSEVTGFLSDYFSDERLNKLLEELGVQVGVSDSNPPSYCIYLFPRDLGKLMDKAADHGAALTARK